MTILKKLYNSIADSDVHFKFLDGTYCQVLQVSFWTHPSWRCVRKKKHDIVYREPITIIIHYLGKPVQAIFWVCSQNSLQIHLFASVPTLLGKCYCQIRNGICASFAWRVGIGIMVRCEKCAYISQHRHYRFYLGSSFQQSILQHANHKVQHFHTDETMGQIPKLVGISQTNSLFWQ